MPKPQNPQIDGILNINKPYGMTSMDVVRRIKRAAGQRRVGHGGTLDPIATGVLPICLGQATRLMEDVVAGGKTYLASIELGVSTNTYDALGDVTERADASHITRPDIERALPAFCGEILQVPPMYSALKRDGKRLYDLARAGVEIEREPRPVVVHNIALQDWTPPVAIVRVSTGKGFYVRSLAHDLGQALGVGGSMQALQRVSSGALTVADAISLDEAAARLSDGTWREVVHSPDIALRTLRALILGSRQEAHLRNGRPLDAATTGATGATGATAASTASPPPHSGERCRAYAADGRFLATITYDAPAHQWRPEKVFALNYPE